MRALLLFFIISFTITSANSQDIEGTYANKWESASGEAIEYSLTLHDNGKFTFYSIRTFLNSDPNHIIEAEGTWQLRGQLLKLNTEEDINELTKDLNANKARYVSVSPRNPNFNLIKPSFKFYGSNVFYAKNMVLFKTETSVSVSH